MLIYFFPLRLWFWLTYEMQRVCKRWTREEKKTCIALHFPVCTFKGVINFITQQQEERKKNDNLPIVVKPEVYVGSDVSPNFFASTQSTPEKKNLQLWLIFHFSFMLTLRFNQDYTTPRERESVRQVDECSEWNYLQRVIGGKKLIFIPRQMIYLICEARGVDMQRWNLILNLLHSLHRNILWQAHSVHRTMHTRWFSSRSQF